MTIQCQLAGCEAALPKGRTRYCSPEHASEAARRKHREWYQPKYGRRGEPLLHPLGSLPEPPPLPLPPPPPEPEPGVPLPPGTWVMRWG